MNVVAIAARTERAPARSLDAALALAARGDGLTFIAMRVPLVAPSAIVDAWPDEPLVAWSSTEVTIVGVGIAAELRGAGPARFAQVAAAARATRIHGAIVVSPIGETTGITRSNGNRSLEGNGSVATLAPTESRNDAGPATRVNGTDRLSLDAPRVPTITTNDARGFAPDASTVSTIDAFGVAHGASTVSTIDALGVAHGASPVSTIDALGVANGASTGSTIDALGVAHGASTGSTIDALGVAHGASAVSTIDAIDALGVAHGASTVSTIDAIDALGVAHGASTVSTIDALGVAHGASAVSTFDGLAHVAPTAPTTDALGVAHVAPTIPTRDAFGLVGVPTISAVETLGFARPRFLGGAAFAPGAANAQPWAGFGDAWFVLPRWTYVHDGSSAWLVLAVDPITAREPLRCDAELAVFRRALAIDAPTWARATSDDSTPTWARPATHATRPATEARPRRDSHARFDTSDEASDLYRTQVEAITSAIATGECSKIVAARSCAIALDDTTTIASALAALDARHPECFRVVVRPPGGGALIAATPERLVRLDADGIRCDALAGTVRLDSPDAEARLLASDKDRREHAIVVDAIRDALASVGASVDAPGAPAIKRLRHVLHLHTPIRATVPRASTSLHLLDLAARLHPTPAVGGTPTAFAIDWIRDHEPMPRGWYASPVGWFDLDGNGELAVAIRSGVLTGDHAHLWAGAGIVAGSDPDRELAETELKLRAMLGALRGGAS